MWGSGSRVQQRRRAVLVRRFHRAVFPLAGSNARACLIDGFRCSRINTGVANAARFNNVAVLGTGSMLRCGQVIRIECDAPEPTQHQSEAEGLSHPA